MKTGKYPDMNSPLNTPKPGKDPGPSVSNPGTFKPADPLKIIPGKG